MNNSLEFEICNCGQQFDKGDKFCVNCGKKIQKYSSSINKNQNGSTVTCQKCNSILNSSDNYCRECGNQVVDLLPADNADQYRSNHHYILHCLKCGSLLTRENSFCGNCGSKTGRGAISIRNSEESSINEPYLCFHCGFDMESGYIIPGKQLDWVRVNFSKTQNKLTTHSTTHLNNKRILAYKCSICNKIEMIL